MVRRDRRRIGFASVLAGFAGRCAFWTWWRQGQVDVLGAVLERARHRLQQTDVGRAIAPVDDGVERPFDLVVAGNDGRVDRSHVRGGFGGGSVACHEPPEKLAAYLCAFFRIDSIFYVGICYNHNIEIARRSKSFFIFSFSLCFSLAFSFYSLCATEALQLQAQEAVRYQLHASS